MGNLISAEAKPAEVRIGATRTLVRGSDAANTETMTELLSVMFSAQTGVRIQGSTVRDGKEVARLLDAGEITVGLMPGIELAWLKKQHPGLKPVLLTCNESISLKANLIVRADASVKRIDDLKAKTLAFPKLNFSHCYLFLDKAIRAAGHDPAKFFAQCNAVNGPDEALEAVLEGQADAAVVDALGMEVYRQRKPGRARRLRTLVESAKFPCAAMICKCDNASDETLKKVCQGLSTAHQRIAGRQMLSLMRLTHICAVPQEYEQLLEDILKEYPEPVEPINFTTLKNGEVKATTQQPR
jgi:ABC-type phosphate/phosphonate transport system substrate-binding protein